MLVSKTRTKPDEQPPSRGLREPGTDLKCGCSRLDSCSAEGGAAPFPSGRVVHGWSHLCGHLRQLALLSNSERSGAASGDRQWDGKLNVRLRGQKRGIEAKTPGCHLRTCQMVCHSGAKVTGWSIIWLKSAFHLGLFFFNPDWNLNLLEDYQEKIFSNLGIMHIWEKKKW